MKNHPSCEIIHCMCIHVGVVIEHARESERRLFISNVTWTVDKWLCSQARATSNRIVNYFAWLKMRTGIKWRSWLVEKNNRSLALVSERDGLRLAFWMPEFSFLFYCFVRLWSLQVLGMWSAFSHWIDWCKPRDYCLQFGNVSHIFY